MTARENAELRLAIIIAAKNAAQAAGGNGLVSLCVYEASSELVEAAAALPDASRSVFERDGKVRDVVHVGHGLALSFHGIDRPCLAHGEVCETDGCEFGGES